MALTDPQPQRPYATRPKSLEEPQKVRDLIWRHWPPDGYRQQVDRVRQNKTRGQDSQGHITHTI